jgi:hypothetical protein
MDLHPDLRKWHPEAWGVAMLQVRYCRADVTLRERACALTT